MLSISCYTMLCISVYWLSCQFIVLIVGLYLLFMSNAYLLFIYYYLCSVLRWFMLLFVVRCVIELWIF